MFVGWPWIFERTARLAQEAVEMLAAIPGVEMITPRDHMAGLISFRISGWTAEAALEELSKRTFCIARTIPPLGALRISTGFFNTSDELRHFADGVALLAAHTPEKLPPRPHLEILRGGRE
jgi:selenocysteine lyase/cysteine desulfurase